MMNDPVRKPNHYNKGNVEALEAIEAATTDLQGIEAVITGNVIKHMWRWKSKDGVQELEKAKYYIERLLDILHKPPDSGQIELCICERIDWKRVKVIERDNTVYELCSVCNGSVAKWNKEQG